MLRPGGSLPRVEEIHDKWAVRAYRLCPANYKGMTLDSRNGDGRNGKQVMVGEFFNGDDPDVDR